MTQIKASYGAALLFSPGQHNFIPTYSRKRKAPVVSRCTNWYQTSIKVNSEAPDSESLDPPEREKKTQSGTSTSKSLKLIGSPWCCSHRVWWTNMTHHKKNKPLFSQMKTRVATREQTQLWPYWFPPERRFCDKHKWISQAGTINLTCGCVSTNCSKSSEHVQHVWLLTWPLKERETI